MQMSKDEITKSILNMFTGNEVMFAYYCGSISYQTADEKSDIDVTVVLQDFNGLIHTNLGNVDIFCYGYNTFVKRQAMSEDIPLYNLIYADDIIEAKEHLIYLNPSFEKEFNDVLSNDFSKVLPKFLDAYINYYDLIIKQDKEVVKRAYHIIRIKGIIENYQKTGKYEIKVAKKWHDKIIDLKQNWQEKDKQETLDELLKYLDDIKTFRNTL